MENVTNPLQKLFILALLQKQNEIEEAESILVNALYLSYISEVTKSEIQRERPIFTDPTGLAELRTDDEDVDTGDPYDVGDPPITHNNGGSTGGSTGSGGTTYGYGGTDYGYGYDQYMYGSFGGPSPIGGSSPPPGTPRRPRRGGRGGPVKPSYAQMASKYPERFAIKRNPHAGHNYSGNLSGKVAVKQATPNIASNDPDMISTGGTGNTYKKGKISFKRRCEIMDKIEDQQDMDIYNSLLFKNIPVIDVIEAGTKKLLAESTEAIYLRQQGVQQLGGVVPVGTGGGGLLLKSKVIIPTLTGALVAGATSLAISKANNESTADMAINFAISTIAGGIVGLAATRGGLKANIFIGAATSGASSYLSQRLTGDKQVNAFKVFFDSGVGGVAGGFVGHGVEKAATVSGGSKGFAKALGKIASFLTGGLTSTSSSLLFEDE